MIPTKPNEEIVIAGVKEVIRRKDESLLIGMLKITRIEIVARTRDPSVKWLLLEVINNDVGTHLEIVPAVEFTRFCRVALDLLK